MDDWTIEDVAARFEDAVTTGRRLPQVRAGGYGSAWPPVLRQEWERLATDDTPVWRPPPDPKAIERMLEAMRWVQWLEVETRHLVWMRAKHYEWHQIARRFGCDRTTAWRRWQKALATVADHLNKKAINYCGI
jgi:predicted DNA-binding protein (UPF0251 family)